MSGLSMVIIETPGLTVRLDGEASPDLPDQALALFREVSAGLAKQRRAEALAPTEVRGGSVTGFVIEPADESLHDLLPGGWVR